MTPEETREFMLTIRMALLIIIRWIEKKYSIEKGN